MLNDIRSVSFFGLACGQQTIAYFPTKRDAKDADLSYSCAGNRLYEKEFQQEVLKDNCAGNVPQVFEDKSKSRYEAWDIDIYYQEKMITVSDIKVIFTSWKSGR